MPALSFRGRRAPGNLPAWQYRPLELGQQELLDLRRAVAVHKRLDPWLVLVNRPHHDQIDIGTFGIFARMDASSIGRKDIFASLSLIEV